MWWQFFPSALQGQMYWMSVSSYSLKLNSDYLSLIERTEQPLMKELATSRPKGHGNRGGQQYDQETWMLIRRQHRQDFSSNIEEGVFVHIDRVSSRWNNYVVRRPPLHSWLLHTTNPGAAGSNLALCFCKYNKQALSHLRSKRQRTGKGGRTTPDSFMLSGVEQASQGVSLLVQCLELRPLTK